MESSPFVVAVSFAPTPVPPFLSEVPAEYVGEFVRAVVVAAYTSLCQSCCFILVSTVDVVSIGE